MYNVTVNGNLSTSVASYEKAIPAARAAATEAANELVAKAERIRASNLYRSPKARRNVAAALTRQALNAVAAVTRAGVFPKKSGNVIVSGGGVTVEILKA